MKVYGKWSPSVSLSEQLVNLLTSVHPFVTFETIQIVL